MRKSLASGVGVAAALVVVFGAGSAGAINEYNGYTYAQAQESISSGGRITVIRSREGSYLPTEKCIVVGSRDTSGPAGRKVLLDLNCNDSVGGTHPGNSAASVSGKQAKALRGWAANINKDFAEATKAGKPSWCEQHADSCQYACDQSEACSAEVLAFLS